MESITSTDLITICIPVYERFDYFIEALESALKQTVKCPVIVVDNASSHNKFKDFVEQKNLSHLKYFRNSENLGMAGNWNRCIELAESEWVTLLHDDDVLDLRFVEFIISKIKINKDRVAMAVKCFKGPLCDNDAFNIETNKNSILLDKLHFMEGGLTAPGLIFKRDTAIEIKGFDQHYHPIFDYVFYYKLFEKGKIELFNEVLAFIRINNDQTSKAEAQSLIDTAYIYRMNLTSNWIERYLVYKCTANMYFQYRKDYADKELKLPFSLFTYRLYYYNFIMYKFIKSKLMLMKNALK